MVGFLTLYAFATTFAWRTRWKWSDLRYYKCIWPLLWAGPDESGRICVIISVFDHFCEQDEMKVVGSAQLYAYLTTFASRTGWKWSDLRYYTRIWPLLWAGLDESGRICVIISVCDHFYEQDTWYDAMLSLSMKKLLLLQLPQIVPQGFNAPGGRILCITYWIMKLVYL